ncbi:MAG TPA: DUF3866 family protein [Actinomycetota bacterium]|nr:DUF3866 family protein [Actinomycetota bacterium]
MTVLREGKVVEVVHSADDLIRATVAVDSEVVASVGWPAMLGPLAAGDRVVVNMVGIGLRLGTGGEAFILWNLDGVGPSSEPAGHIVKLRYTPWQIPVAAVEAPESPHHEALADAVSLEGMPVVVCSLHSQVGAAAAGIKAPAPHARVGYLMTDGGALPLAWSEQVRALKAAALIDDTCTVGHAFGGDLEAINVFSGLVALKVVARVNAIVAALGPGIVGTSTALGFTGMEQGQLLDAVTALGGHSIACLRLSFADDRPRHRGVSRHSLMALSIAAREPTDIVVPKLPPARRDEVIRQLDDAGICRRHRLVFASGSDGLRLLEERDIQVESMGRSATDVPELFAAAAAAGGVAGASIATTG